jgi:hypothetical protein
MVTSRLLFMPLARFKRAFQIAIVVVIGIAVTWGPHIAWLLRPSRSLSVAVVDKTVPFRNFREHGFFDWLLRASKIKSPEGRFLEEERDYVGYDPVAKVGHDLEPSYLAKADALFIADTYGVYRGDYERPGDVAALERSPRMYGGLSDAEAAAIEAFSARAGLLIGEFNTFASPTPDSARDALERTFGVRWTHWVGRYWPNIQDHNEVPRWVGTVYERIYKKPLTVTGAVFVFVREDEDMVVLEAGKHLNEDVIAIEQTNDAPSGWPEHSSYWYWLDVVEQTDAAVLYEHVLDLTPDGRALMAEHKLAARFPALTQRHGRATYYFAGDFVDSGVERPSPENLGTLWWRRTTIGRSGTPDERFLWGWYVPILERLIEPRLR